jgi:diacylglycerol O-acyltransferase / wax synthase
MARPIPVVDLVFLLIDRAETPANIGIALAFEPPPGTSADKALREVMRAYRAAKPTSPFDAVPEVPPLGVPQWVARGRVDMKQHLRRETLPAPGSPTQLNERLAELHRDRLDRSRPLFEIHLIDGLASGQFVLYIKSHHVSWDGFSAATRIFASLSAEPGPLLPGFHAQPPAAPPDPEGAGGGLRSLMTHALALGELYTQVTNRVAALRTKPGHARGNTPFAGPHTRLNQRVVAERSVARLSLPLEEMRRVAHAFGGSINDVLLAVTDDGVRRYLAGLGERPTEPLVAMCPVSIRDPGDFEATTKVSTMFVRLAGPRRGGAGRLREIVASVAAAKAEFRSMSREATIDFAALAFGLWLASDTFGLAAFTKPVVNFVVSNVGGIKGARYLGRSRLVGTFPISMVADPAGLNFTSFSHDGRMDVGIVASRAAVPDADSLAQHCLAAWQQLRKAKPPQDLTLRKPPARRPSRTRRMPASQRG